VRHARKYAEADLGPECTFHFQLRDGATRHAVNVLQFAALLDEIDEWSWRFHQDRGDFARWLLDCIGDEALAREATRTVPWHDFHKARTYLKQRITDRYTAAQERLS
jgi:hypothetical protein